MQKDGFVRYSRPTEEFAKHDLHLFIDDGRDDITWLPPKPNACWLVDTHLGYGSRLEWAKHFDTVFLAQLPDVEKMKLDGIENVHWLPLACSPYLDPCYAELQAHAGDKMDLSRAYDCAFVGFLNRGVEGDRDSHDRVAFLDYMFKAFPESWLAFNLFFTDAAARYIKARVGLNISIKQDLNMRFFESMSYGVCQLANRDMIGREELGFVEGEHFLGYSSPEEAESQVKWALQNPEQREKIAEAGHALVRSKHTYEDRVMQLLETATP